MLLKEIGKAKAKVLRALDLEPQHNTVGDTNGEMRFLVLIGAMPEIAAYDSIIDVGANRGDWTAVALERFSKKGIEKFFCVEPVPTFAADLKRRFDAENGVHYVERVLSNCSGGFAEIFDIGGGGRMYRDFRGSEKVDASSKKIVSHKVEVSTGDEVFGALDIKPYLVKIDCDGHDYHVLSGFREILRQRRPLVQFEYSDFWIGAGSRLKQACALLEEVGYNCYKMFPDRLVRFRFNPLFETFGYQNIVAAPREFQSFSGKTIDLPLG